jgi:hypothetical protein
MRYRDTGGHEAVLKIVRNADGGTRLCPSGRHLMLRLAMASLVLVGPVFWSVATWFLCKPWRSLPALAWWLSVVAIFAVTTMRDMPVRRHNQRSPLPLRSRLCGAAFILYAFGGAVALLVSIR